ALDAADADESQRILAEETRVLAEIQEPSIPWNGLNIIAARWGAGSQWVDVTQRIRVRVKDGVLKIVPQYANLPDPKFGTNKSLVVVASIEGTCRVAIVGHDEMLVVPAK